MVCSNDSREQPLAVLVKNAVMLQVMGFKVLDFSFSIDIFPAYPK
jgi:hypothetical protein